MRKLAAAAMFLVVATVTALAGVHWTRSGATVLTVVNTASAEHRWTPDKPLFILLLGHDLRPGAGCGCTDSMHLVAVPAGGGSAVFLDIPRDTRVLVPGFGMTRINEAWGRAAVDKEQAAAWVVGTLVGVKIDYTILIGFTDLPKLIDELGGVTVNVPEKMDDPNSGANFERGPVKMNGEEALAFSRNRHLAGGDFTRSSNQTLLMLAVLAKLRGQGGDPASEFKYLSVLARHSVLHDVSNTDLYRLGRLALSIDPKNARNVIMPGTSELIGGVAYVEPTADARPLFADLADDAILESH